MSSTPDANSHRFPPDSTKIPSSPDYQPDLEINPLEFVRLLKQNRKKITAAVVGVMVLVTLVMVFTPNRYRSSASILPTGSRDNLSGLMDLAGQFGATGTRSADENSSALYPSILRSDLVRDGVLRRRYDLAAGPSTETVKLSDYFELSDPSELRTALTNSTSIDQDKKLGIIRLAVETTRPELSQAVLAEYLAQLENYLRLKRRSQARENETYLAGQQTLHGEELRHAEDSLQHFMNVNRNWNSSSDPQLQTELARLRRDVELHAKTYSLISQQLEMARLEAQKDIPIVRILDEPSLPTLKSGPRRTFSVLLAGFLTLLTMMTWYFVRDLWRQVVNAAGADAGSEPDRGNMPPSRSSRILNLLRRTELTVEPNNEQRQPVEHG